VVPAERVVTAAGCCEDPGTAAGLDQRLVLGYRLADEALRRPAGDGGESDGVALQQREATPARQSLEQIGQV
jgi:hypothetical protein